MQDAMVSSMRAQASALGTSVTLRSWLPRIMAWMRVAAVALAIAEVASSVGKSSWIEAWRESWRRETCGGLIGMNGWGAGGSEVGHCIELEGEGSIEAEHSIPGS